MGKLKVVSPLQITDAMLVNSDVPETDYPAWSSVSTYALGERMVSVANHRVYESLQNANVNHAPGDPLWWVEVSPTNRWRLFDTSNSTQTSKPYDLSYTLTPASPCSALAALNLSNVNTIRVRVSHPAYGALYDRTADLRPLPVAAGWWDWFFGPRESPTQHIALDLPGIPGAEIRVDLTGGAAMAIGVLLIGQAIEIGRGVRYGAKVGIQDFSRKETNDFGDTVLVRRAFAKRASFDLLLPAGEVDALLAALAALRATPCLWIGSSRYESSIVFGIYKQFDVLIAYPNFSTCQIELEGLT